MRKALLLMLAGLAPVCAMIAIRWLSLKDAMDGKAKRRFGRAALAWAGASGSACLALLLCAGRLALPGLAASAVALVLAAVAARRA